MRFFRSIHNIKINRKSTGLSLVSLLLAAALLAGGCAVSSRTAPEPEVSPEILEEASPIPPPASKEESSPAPKPEESSPEESSKAPEPPAEEPSKKPETAPVQLQDIYPIADETVSATLRRPMEELLPLDNTAVPWGPGPTSGEVRPAAPVDLQARYQALGAHFIAPETSAIYLTFDEGYDAGYNEEILDVLWEKEVKAIFFVTLGFVKSRPDLVQRMVAEGHQLGNHSWKHIEFPAMAPMDCAKDVLYLHQYVEENFGYTMTLCRPPAGAFSQRTLALLQALGYESMFWSFAYRDWLLEEQPDHATALETIVGRSHPGAIYLLHAVSRTNAAVLPQAIDALQEKGYQFSLWQA